MPYTQLGDDSSIPLILRGSQSAATPYVAPKPAEVPLINQGGGVYNFPELFATAGNSNAPAAAATYTPAGRAKKDTMTILLVIAAAAGFALLGVGGGGGGRHVW